MKNFYITTAFVILMMTMYASPAYADWASEDVTMQVGETKTLYLPSYITSKNLKSVNFYSASISHVQVLSHTNYSVKVKAIKAYSTPVIVRCDYYYYINNGGYIYQASGAYDFKITVAGETEVKPEKVETPLYLQLSVGESKPVNVTVTPPNAVYTLSYHIANTSIAEVSSNGIVYGKQAGETDLKVMADNGKYSMSRVIVSAKKPESVSIQPNLTLELGQSKYLSASVTPSDAQYTLSWSSNNESVATVSQYGLVTAVGAGTAKITVRTDNGKTAICNVTVNSNSVTSIEIEASIALNIGDEYTLTPTITPSNASTTLTWTTSNSSVATVTQSGVVKAINSGSAIIKVITNNGLSAQCVIAVREAEVETYKMSYTVYGNGHIAYNNQMMNSNGEFEFEAHSDLAFEIVPNKGYMIKWLWLDYHDVEDQLVDNIFTINDAAKDMRLVVFFEEDTSAIEDINNDLEQKEKVIYDISGRRVMKSEMRNGIYIINGKKMLIR